MEVKVCNIVANAETSVVLQTLKQLSDSNEVLCNAETKDMPGTKGNEIFISIIYTLALNVSSALIYDLLKMAFRQCYGNGSSKEAEDVKISVEVDGKKEDWEFKS